jgi:hypothetical protein
MILAEQGHYVEKWTTADPIHGLQNGDRLWGWINEGKVIHAREARRVIDFLPLFDVVIDNFRRDTWRRWGLEPTVLARLARVTWVSLRADDDGRSFDVIAQQRAWGDLTPPVPFYLGDTAAGLWLAFAALAKPPGHHVIRQAACLSKLVEGEAMVDREIPWDPPGTYGLDDQGRAAVTFKGETITEPPRDAQWRRANLINHDGRFTV